MAGYQLPRVERPLHPALLPLAFKPFRDMFIYSGRSRRSEVVAFFILSMVCNAISVEFGDSANLFNSVIHWAWTLLWQFPWIALFVRRLHDQGKSARWAWTLGAIFLTLMAAAPLLPQSPDGSYRVGVLGWTFHPVGPHATVHWIIALFLALGIFGLSLAEGEPGTNSYGPDPRLDPEERGETAAG